MDFDFQAQRCVDATLRFATNCQKLFGPDKVPTGCTVHYFLTGIAIQCLALEAVS
jgi:hypothetical protein